MFCGVFKKFNNIAVCSYILMNMFSDCFSVEVYANSPFSTLTVEQAKKLAVAKDQKLYAINTKRSFQYIKRKAAQESIANVRKKESTIRFSLLFNIKWPEKHGLPKELDLITKIPKIDAETTLLKEEAKNRQREVEEKVEKCLIKSYCLQEAIDTAKKNKELLEKDILKLESGILTGAATSEDLEASKKSYEEAKENLMLLYQDFEKSTCKLSDMIGIDVSQGYSFENPLTTLTIPREKLKDMVDYAMNNRYDVFQAESTKKLACRKVDEIFAICKDQHGSKANQLEQEVRSTGSIDYDNFLKKYENYLTNIDEPWSGAYKIWLLFFVIKIPKEWFKGEYSGTRYLEDEKYALPEALLERDDARRQENILKNSVKESLQDEYESIVVSKMHTKMH